MPSGIFQPRAVKRISRSLFATLSTIRAAFAEALFGVLISALAVPVIAPAQGHHTASSVTDKRLPSREDYIGDQACRSCHAEEFNSYQATAHHLTSRVADAHSIAGSFTPGTNLFKTANPSLYFKMTADADGFHQTAVDEVSPGKNIELSERFDIVVGVRKSQTYLYWKGDELFELPVSWWSGSDQWINSPGYEDGAVRFDRPIYPRCLECHGSYFKSLAPPPNKYDPTSLTLGIGCERCHGPGREHVALYSSTTPPPVNPLKTSAPKAIVNPASLPRNRQVDACALCHAGSEIPFSRRCPSSPETRSTNTSNSPTWTPTSPSTFTATRSNCSEKAAAFVRAT